jgi:hypothetical protein
VDDSQREQRFAVLLVACESGHRAGRTGANVKESNALCRA